MFRLSPLLVTTAALNDATWDETSLMQGVKLQHVNKEDKSKSVSNLLETAKTMFKNGATNDVVTFAQSTLDEIADQVLPRITDAHNADQLLVTQTHSMFQEAYDELKTGNAQIAGLYHAEREHSVAHKACRGSLALCQEGTECDICEEKRDCDYDLWRIWKHFAWEEMDLRFKSTEIENHFCAEHANGTRWEFRDYSVAKFPGWIAQKTVVDSWEVQYDGKVPECESAYSILDRKTEECDAHQTNLELASCEFANKAREVRNRFSDFWLYAVGTYQRVVDEVHCLEIDRWKEWRTLSTVQCLLQATSERNGRPCDESTPEHDEVAARCENFQVSVSIDDLRIDFPPAPPQPDPCTTVDPSGGSHERCALPPLPVASESWAPYAACLRENCEDIHPDIFQHSVHSSCENMVESLSCDGQLDGGFLVSDACPSSCQGCTASDLDECLPIDPHAPCSAGYVNQEYAELWNPPQAVFHAPGYHVDDHYEPVTQLEHHERVSEVDRSTDHWDDIEVLRRTGNSHCNERPECVPCTVVAASTRSTIIDEHLENARDHPWVTIPETNHTCQEATMRQMQQGVFDANGDGHYSEPGSLGQAQGCEAHSPPAPTGAWTLVLQYGTESYPANSGCAGLPSESETGHAKYSDADINSLPGPSSQYNYYKMTSDGGNGELIIRTPNAYDDTAEGLGWRTNYAACTGGSSATGCTSWSSDYSGHRLDNINRVGNNCARWFLDYHNLYCYRDGDGSFGTTGHHCWNTGSGCGNHRIRTNVKMYKCTSEDC